MFKSLEIRNFQSHSKTVIDFSSGVNIFTGSSNSGKTAILRALNWIINNRPLGTSFIRRGQKKSEVVLFIGEKTKEMGISRFKDSIDNCYSLATSDAVGDIRLETVGKDVPQEIRDILNFSDINTQEQLSPYFLVLDTPGRIAIYLNSITHLDEIDKIVSLLKSRLKVVDNEILNLDTQLSGLQIELDEIARLNLEEFEVNLKTAQDITKQIDAMRLDTMLLNDIVIKLEITEKNLVKIPVDIDVVEKEATEILEDYKKVKEDRDFFRTVVWNLVEVEKKLVELPYDIGCLIQEATQAATQYCKIVDDINKLIIIQEDIEKVDLNIREFTGILDSGRAVEQKLLSELWFCPVCEHRLSETAKSKVLENYK